MEYTFSYASPLGKIMLTSDGDALTGLQFDRPKGGADTPLPVFTETVRWLDMYFGGKKPDFTPPLRMDATPFRRSVWELLLTIPYGDFVTYGQLAEQLAQKQGLPHMSAQAVGGAVGHNPILLIVPCHRVVGADGSLTGYAAGLDRKCRLLAMEQGML
ncbi:MAG: methylated-DNA--[Oscillospiraceae bacterium]|nr:methylated-DNA--[protein]-cysteine S-methyltransferase [Oscillospiraceae bacterium]